jgi:hypothetical protein
VWGSARAARKQIVVRVQADFVNPRLQRLSGLIRNFKLHGPLRLLLDDDSALCDKAAMVDIADTQCHQIA